MQNNPVSLEKKILNIEEPVVKRKTGRPKGARNEKYVNYAMIKNLLKSHTQSETAEKLEVSRQAINSYTTYHSMPFSTLKNKREKIIKKLVEEDLTRIEIAGRMKINYRTLVSYLLNHPEFPKPKIKTRKGIVKNKKRYNQIKRLLKKKFSLSKIARIIGYSQGAVVSRYIKRHPEIKRNLEKLK